MGDKVLEAARELRRRCGLPPKACRAAVRKHRGDADAALAALVDAGKVLEDDLNAELVGDELFVRARTRKLRELLAMHDRGIDDWRAESPYLLAVLERERRQHAAELKALETSKAKGLRGEQLKLQRKRRRQEEEMAAMRSAERKARKDLGLAVVELPPFPTLKVNSLGERVGRDTLASWAGSYENRKGVIEVEVLTPDDAEGPLFVPPLLEQIAAYRHLKENEAEVTNAILKAVFKNYSKMKKVLFPRRDDDVLAEEMMPDVRTPDDLRKVVGVYAVTVMPYAKRGVAYVGYTMRCTWDPEHQCGVMTHKSRVLAVGQGDMASEHYVHRKDGGQPLTGRRKRASS